MKAVEIEICSEVGDNWYAPFLDRMIRGRIDFAHLAKHERNALQLSHQYPDGIPGQRLAVDFTAKEGLVIESLHEPRWAELRAKIAKRSYAIDPQRTAFALADGNAIATWLHWMRRAVSDGHARLVAGEFPDKLPGVPRKEFRLAAGPDSSERTIERLTAILLATLTPEQQARVDELLGAGV